MSRCGRAIELLSQWRDHPRGCKDEHGFRDGYDGPCTDDPWDVAQELDTIDPMFRRDETKRLRDLLKLVAPAALAAYDEWQQTPVYARPKDPAIYVWTATHALMWKEHWVRLYPEAQQAMIERTRQNLVLHALEHGAAVTGFSEPKEQPDPSFPRGYPPMLVIEATGWTTVPIPSVDRETMNATP